MNKRTLNQRSATAVRILKEHGLRALWKRAVSSRVRHIQRPIERFDFVLAKPVGQPILRGQVDSKTINWVVPQFTAGAGGHTTIFRFVHFLEQQGFTCRVIIDGGISSGTSAQYRQLIRESFFPLDAEVFVDFEDAPPAFITVATGWESAYSISGIKSTVHKCYFVQDFEPWFYAVGSEHCLAEATYRLGYRGITAGSWLSDKLRADYGMKSDSINFSCDKAVYFPRARQPSPKKQVFFYARPSTERRAFELGLLVLSELSKRMPDVTVLLAGGDLANYDIPFDHVSEGVVSVQRLAELFSQCDAALVLSLTNVSLLPLEIMACGTPVVSNSGPWVEWLLTQANSFLAMPTVNGLVDALHSALSDEDARTKVRAEGLRLAAATSWEHEAVRMGDIFRSLENE